MLRKPPTGQGWGINRGATLSALRVMLEYMSEEELAEAWNAVHKIAKPIRPGRSFYGIHKPRPKPTQEKTCNPPPPVQ